jgi:Na+/alanine symporter
MYSIVLFFFYFWREMKQYICGIEKATAIGKHGNSYYLLLLLHEYVSMCGSGNVVGIATAYGLDGPGIESRRG